MLVCLTISSTFIASTTMLIGAIEQSTQLYVYANLILVLDTFLNAICFMLQFKFNKIMYFKICGCCHFNCYKFMTKTAILEESVLNCDVNTGHTSRELTTRTATTDIVGKTEITKPHHKYNGIHASLSLNSNVSDTEKGRGKEKEKEKEKEKTGNDSDVAATNVTSEIEIVDHDND